MLADAGALAPDSRTSGQLAALCAQLGVIGHGITAPPEARIPDRWTSIVAQRQARPTGLGSAARAEGFVPLALVLPDIDGTRFALAGLSAGGGQSYLHLAVSGLAEPARRLRPGWRPAFSVWLREPAGRWHIATTRDRLTRTAGHGRADDAADAAADRPAGHPGAGGDGPFGQAPDHRAGPGGQARARNGGTLGA